MFFRRTVLTVIELFRTISIAHSRSLTRGLKTGMIAMILALASSLLIYESVKAKRSTLNDSNPQSSQTAFAIPPARYSHYVKPVALADVASSVVTTVSAASFESVPVAPGSIVTAFGPNIATTTLIANTTPLPTELGGTSVEVNGRKAGLFFVSESQINYLMPDQTELGVANVVVKTGANSYTGAVMVAQVAPGLFTANASGQGVPAATVLRSKVNGLLTYEPLSQWSATAGEYVTKPVDLGPDSDRVFLILFLTGVRNAAYDGQSGSLNEKFRVLIGGIAVQPLYVGPQMDFVGLDQINVEIPRSLIGQGLVDVSVIGLGYGSSNTVKIEIAGPSTKTPPQIGSLVGLSALAGTRLTIQGSGFSSKEDENIVRISGHEAKVLTASPTQLDVMVPFGVEAGTVSVTTVQGGEGRSSENLAVRTSISGVVEDTQGNPLGDVIVRMIVGGGQTTSTSNDGSFVLADVESGRKVFIADGNSIQPNYPYPTLPCRIDVLKNRDNQYPSTISLQQVTGSSATVGGGAFTGNSSAQQKTDLASAAPQATVIQTGEFQLQFPDGIKVTTPEGATSATLVLTPVENSRTPVALPYGYYSKSIVQITPFGVTLDPGAKLIFPNADGFYPGTQLTLFRYDLDSGKFVQEKGTATVSADGKRIETGANDIKVTSYYFASMFRGTTTVTGRVLEESTGKPVQRALVRFRGQEAYTDGNGSYILRFVTVDDKEAISVEVSKLRSSTRVDRASSTPAQAVFLGITTLPDVLLPNEKQNRAPNIVVQREVTVDADKTLDIPVLITDPDGDRVNVAPLLGTGAGFATLIPVSTGTKNVYTLHLEPKSPAAGEYEITITAIDSLGGSFSQIIKVFVNKINHPPSATSQTVMVDEEGTVPIKLEGTDPDGDRLTFKVISSPANGVLNGNGSTVVYKPNLNFNGTDKFTFVANDGVADSPPGTVTITVKPVNDPPVLAVPEAQTISEGQPLAFSVSAFDPDEGQTLTITATGLPNGATFTSATPTSSQFRWTPGFTQAGTYVVKFTVTDSGSPQLSDTREVRITVNDTSLLVVPGAQTVNEGQALNFDVSAVPGLPAPVLITLMMQPRPQGVEFPDIASNTGTLRWTPGTAQAGTYNFTFKATINSPTAISEVKTVQVTVVDVVRELAKESVSYSIYGAAGPLPQSLSDEGDMLGSSLATGDLNGDGVPDLAVGAPGANGVGFNNGKVYVFFGRANLLGSIDLAQQKADVEILGEATDDRFGSSLAIGDLNGDGKNDLVIGAPLANVGVNTDAGKVYVVFGNFTTGTSDSITKLAGATLIGNQRGERIGTSVALGSVAPKTGTAVDLMIGAPGFDSPSDAGAVVDTGAVFVFFGGPLLSKTIDLATTPPSFTVTGTTAGGQLGTTLAAGNFNGDELSDFAVGAPLANADGLKGNGAVYLVLGSAELAGTMKNAAQVASLTLPGAAENDGLGAALAMGDLNGDGRADLIISAVGASAPDKARQGVGAVYVVYGGTNLQGRSPDLTVLGAGASGDGVPDALGKTLAVGDFNGDGVADLAIGAPGADNADPKRDPVGMVYVIYGARSRLTGTYDLATKAADYTVVGADPGDHLGAAAVVFANINASDPADLILGIPKGRSVDNARVDAGEVRIINGSRR